MRTRHRREQSWQLNPPPHGRVIRAATPEDSGVQTQYDRFVSSGRVDRAEWALVVQELINAHTGGKKEPFARLVGVNPRTLYSWLDKDVAVSEQSVRQVAAACGLNEMELLIRVGFYRRESMPPRVSDEVIDEEIQAVLDDPDLDDVVKAGIIAEFESWRTTDDQLIAAQRERDQRLRAERLAARLDRAKREHLRAS